MKYSKEQEEIIYDNSKYLQIIAAAGSGKTFTIIEMVERVLKEKIFSEKEILMISFSRKACGEIKNRFDIKIPKNNLKIYTFHAYCLRVLKIYHPDFSKTIQIISTEEKEKLFKDLLKKEKFKIGGIPYEFLTDRKNIAHNPELSTIIKMFQDYYSEYKYNSNSIDYDDMVDLYLNGLKNKEEWTEEAAKEVSYIVVDEFQDTDPIQLEWLQQINPKRLTVVGDDWQAIYGFRGASSLPFLNFSSYFSPVKKLFLTINYRSHKKIVSISAIPIKKNKNNIQKKVFSHSNENGEVMKILIPSEESWLKILDLANQKKEYKILVRTNYRIEKLHKIGFPFENLSTIHASKGLEYETVFIDLTDGWTNQSHGDSMNVEEERRILYVGLSRAKHSLFIVGKKSSENGRLESVFLSYF